MGKIHNMLPFRRACLGLLTVATFAQALSQEYCSSENTGSDYSAVSDIYQSNGACYDTCKDSYAFAIVQYQNCWCSNYIPSDQESTSSCDSNCPGYPSDKCGNKDEGLYGYIALPNHQPSGTAGASSSSTQASSTSSVPVSTSSDLPTSTSSLAVASSSSSLDTGTSSSTFSTTSVVSFTSSTFTTSTSSTSPGLTFTSQSSTSQEPTTSTSSTSQAPTTSSYVTPTTSSTSTTSTSSSFTRSNTIAAVVAPVPTSSPTSSPSTTPSPVTSVRVVTVSGDRVTQTVTSTPRVAPGDSANQLPLQKKGISGGAIAGIVIGVLGGLAALAAGLFLLWRRRRKTQQYPETEDSGPMRPNRNISVLSKTGLIPRAGRPISMVEREYADPSEPNTGSVRHSTMFGSAAATSLDSPLDRAVYDQRLNPSVLFANHDNGSRVSMQDQQDYSRPLGVMNPDVRGSFESLGSRT